MNIFLRVLRLVLIASFLCQNIAWASDSILRSSTLAPRSEAVSQEPEWENSDVKFRPGVQEAAEKLQEWKNLWDKIKGGPNAEIMTFITQKCDESETLCLNIQDTIVATEHRGFLKFIATYFFAARIGEEYFSLANAQEDKEAQLMALSFDVKPVLLEFKKHVIFHEALSMKSKEAVNTGILKSLKLLEAFTQIYHDISAYYDFYNKVQDVHAILYDFGLEELKKRSLESQEKIKSLILQQMLALKLLKRESALTLKQVLGNVREAMQEYCKVKAAFDLGEESNAEALEGLQLKAMEALEIYKTEKAAFEKGWEDDLLKTCLTKVSLERDCTLTEGEAFRKMDRILSSFSFPLPEDIEKNAYQEAMSSRAAFIVEGIQNGFKIESGSTHEVFLKRGRGLIEEVKAMLAKGSSGKEAMIPLAEKISEVTALKELIERLIMYCSEHEDEKLSLELFNAFSSSIDEGLAVTILELQEREGMLSNLFDGAEAVLKKWEVHLKEYQESETRKVTELGAHLKGLEAQVTQAEIKEQAISKGIVSGLSEIDGFIHDTQVLYQEFETICSTLDDSSTTMESIASKISDFNWKKDYDKRVQIFNAARAERVREMEPLLKRLKGVLSNAKLSRLKQVLLDKHKQEALDLCLEAKRVAQTIANNPDGSDFASEILLLKERIQSKLHHITHFVSINFKDQIEAMKQDLLSAEHLLNILNLSLEAPAISPLQQALAQEREAAGNLREELTLMISTLNHPGAVNELDTAGLNDFINPDKFFKGKRLLQVFQEDIESLKEQIRSRICYLGKLQTVHFPGAFFSDRSMEQIDRLIDELTLDLIKAEGLELNSAKKTFKLSVDPLNEEGSITPREVSGDDRDARITLPNLNEVMGDPGNVESPVKSRNIVTGQETASDLKAAPHPSDPEISTNLSRSVLPKTSRGMRVFAQLLLPLIILITVIVNLADIRIHSMPQAAAIHEKALTGLNIPSHANSAVASSGSPVMNPVIPEVASKAHEVKNMNARNDNLWKRNQLLRKLMEQGGRLMLLDHISCEVNNGLDENLEKEIRSFLANAKREIRGARALIGLKGGASELIRDTGNRVKDLEKIVSRLGRFPDGDVRASFICNSAS